MVNSYSVNIYRAPGGDCTNHGLSSKFTRGVLYRDPAPPAVAGVAIFVLDETPIRSGKRIRAVPAGETRWTMFGGNFLWSSDSRFRNEVSELPIPIHDRVED